MSETSYNLSNTINSNAELSKMKDQWFNSTVKSNNKDKSISLQDKKLNIEDIKNK